MQTPTAATRVGSKRRKAEHKPTTGTDESPRSDASVLVLPFFLAPRRVFQRRVPWVCLRGHAWHCASTILTHLKLPRPETRPRERNRADFFLIFFVYSLLACDLSDHGEVIYSPFPGGIVRSGWPHVWQISRYLDVYEIYGRAPVCSSAPRNIPRMMP